MTTAQSLKIFEILGKHFQNSEDAKIFRKHSGNVKNETAL